MHLTTSKNRHVFLSVFHFPSSFIISATNTLKRALEMLKEEVDAASDAYNAKRHALGNEAENLNPCDVSP